MMEYYENGKHGGLPDFMEKYAQRDEITILSVLNSQIKINKGESLTYL